MEEIDMETLKVGDVVQLKSGGPKMTINAIVGDGGTSKIVTSAAKMAGFKDGSVSCIWFSERGQEKGYFFADTIKLC